MISFSENNTEIFGMLEAKGQLPADFDADSVYAFDVDEDLCLIMYAGSARDFYLFTAHNYRHECAVLEELLEELVEADLHVSVSLLDEATALVEEKIRSQDSSRFYFDAH
jgi:hypothetical protein